MKYRIKFDHYKTDCGMFSPIVLYKVQKQIFGFLWISVVRNVSDKEANRILTEIKNTEK